MRALAKKLVHAAAIAGMLSGLAASPALADHDDDGHHRWRGRHRHEYAGDYYRPRPRYYYRDYDYYSEPRVEYYAAPRVYVPAPPSFGLSLIFPFHHH